MLNTKLKAAIVGTGFIAPAHIEALRRNNIEVLGLVGENASLAQSKAKEWGVPRPYSSLEEMLRDGDIGVVHLATPNFLHFPQAKACLEAGKHVFCEKPLAMNSKESSEMIALAKKKQLAAAINFNLRFYPMVHMAKDHVQSGKLGDIFIAQGFYSQDWMLYDTDWNWRLVSKEGGSLRAVADIGSHWLDMISFITGLKVSAVFADFKTFHPKRKRPLRPIETFSGKTLSPSDYEEYPIDTEDFAMILLRFENGARGMTGISQVSAGRKNRLMFEIYGSRSGISWNSEEPNRLWIGHRERANEILLKDPALMPEELRSLSPYPGGHQEGFPDILKHITKKFYSYAEAGDFSKKPDFPTFEDGHYEVLLCEALEKSAKTQTWIELA